MPQPACPWLGTCGTRAWRMQPCCSSASAEPVLCCVRPPVWAPSLPLALEVRVDLPLGLAHCALVVFLLPGLRLPAQLCSVRLTAWANGSSTGWQGSLLLLRLAWRPGLLVWEARVTCTTGGLLSHQGTCCEHHDSVSKRQSLPGLVAEHLFPVLAASAVGTATARQKRPHGSQLLVYYEQGTASI